MTTVVVFDYGSGNLHSVTRAIQSVGADVLVSSETKAALEADGLVIPGVGAFAACMGQLWAVGGEEIIHHRVETRKPLLGICVGHQILFSTGVEHGITYPGVGVFPGEIQQLPTSKLPHMGWNEVVPDPRSVFFRGVQRYYFVHSYAALTTQALPESARGMWAHHSGADFIAAVEYRSILSTQFHPEKSGQSGMALLKRWVDSLGAP